MTRPNRMSPLDGRNARFSIQVGIEEACQIVLAEGRFGRAEAWTARP